MSLELSLVKRRRTPVVLQAEASECGLACLAMIASRFGNRVGLASLRRTLSVSVKGASLEQLMGMARQLKLSARALQLELDELGELDCPCVLHWDFNHFVVLESVRGDRIAIIDPAVGLRRLSASEVGRSFTGVALELKPAPEFEVRQPEQRLGLGVFLQGARGLKSSLAQVLVLSLTIQVLALLAPFYSQLVIDEVVVSSDRDLLLVLALGFGLVALVNVGVSALRSWVILILGSRLGFEWVGRLFHHLLSLPSAYFEKRHVGDVVSRFGSIGAVQNLTTTTAVEAVVDGVMVSTTLVVMLLYSPGLTGLVLAVTLMYALTRALMHQPMRDASQDALVKGARENTHFIESLRAISTIKALSGEQKRESLWQNRLAEKVNAGIRVGRLGLGQSLLSQVLFGAEGIAVIYLGALRVLDQQFTMGMLMAFMAYKGQFSGRAAALIDKVFQFRMARIHLDRLADIVLAEPETPKEDRPTPSGACSVAGRLESRDLWYRYSDFDPWILRDTHLVIEAGECVVLTGPSGCGKSTLLKLMMGLLDPTRGQLLVDGRPLSWLDRVSYRAQTGGVLQNDRLVSGTLAENISFFDPSPDNRRVSACARLAEISSEIDTMPMGYQTRVGDLGSSLSGGQVQRILLARALYRRPRILFLDESSSHLDVRTEKRIAQTLRYLKTTRVLVAHRPETIRAADRVIQLEGG